MTFILTHPLPERCIVAFSGGIDSSCALHFLLQTPGRVSHAIHINHCNPLSDGFQRHAEEVCEKYEIPLIVRKIERLPEQGESKEAVWREERLRLFACEVDEHNLPVVTAHNMDDCLEEYVMCTMVRGWAGTIPYRYGETCVRPFRLWKREDIETYAQRHKIDWIEDTSNTNIAFKRALIRKTVVPQLKNLNPGIYKIVERMILIKS